MWSQCDRCQTHKSLIQIHNPPVNPMPVTTFQIHANNYIYQNSHSNPPKPHNTLQKQFILITQDTKIKIPINIIILTKNYNPHNDETTVRLLMTMTCNCNFWGGFDAKSQSACYILTLDYVLDFNHDEASTLNSSNGQVAHRLQLSNRIRSQTVLGLPS